MSVFGQLTPDSSLNDEQLYENGRLAGREEVLAVVRRDFLDHYLHRRTGWSFLRNILRECDPSHGESES